MSDINISSNFKKAFDDSREELLYRNKEFYMKELKNRKYIRALVIAIEKSSKKGF